MVTETHRYDVATQVNHSILALHEQESTQENWEIPFQSANVLPAGDQRITPLYNGFAVENKFGGYDESPYGDASPQQLIVSQITRFLSVCAEPPERAAAATIGRPTLCP